MLDRELTLYAFVLHYCRLLTKDLDDATLAEQPYPGMNHPAWILGHLALSCDYAVKALGGDMVCPKEWHKQFGPGSVVVADRAAYPSKRELLTAVEAGHERVVAAARKATAEQLAAPQPFPIPLLQKAFPTVGDLLAHLMATHPSLHLGQLSAWRRMKGLPAVLGI